ncbi:MAG: acetyl-CoA carboxylase biotin carboxyl carrier protein subunit [Bacteroidetes bacterium]|nr:acetyl-CoA carboxylase biotin carboxyl carrier protein subunit [Bacteroidota bacterium]
MAEKKKKSKKSSGILANSTIYVQVSDGGRRYVTQTSVKMGLHKPWQKPDPEEIRSVIPGSVLALMVQEGDEVAEDQELMVYVAMKMHNVIRAPFAGRVTQIAVKNGDRLQKGALLMVIRAHEPIIDVEPVASELYFEDFE